MTKSTVMVLLKAIVTSQIKNINRVRVLLDMAISVSAIKIFYLLLCT